jgi:hypothetical protein
MVVTRLTSIVPCKARASNAASHPPYQSTNLTRLRLDGQLAIMFYTKMDSIAVINNMHKFLSTSHALD